MELINWIRFDHKNGKKEREEFVKMLEQGNNMPNIARMAKHFNKNYSEMLAIVEAWLSRNKLKEQ